MQAVGWLLAVPGASRTVLDMRIPYSRASMADMLGAVPQSYTSAGAVAAAAGSGVGTQCCHAHRSGPALCDAEPLLSIVITPCSSAFPPGLKLLVCTFFSGGLIQRCLACSLQTLHRQWPELPTVKPSSCLPLALMWWVWAAPARWPQTA